MKYCFKILLFKSISPNLSLEYNIEKLTEMSETLDKNLTTKIIALKEAYDLDIAILQELLAKK